MTLFAAFSSVNTSVPRLNVLAIAHVDPGPPAAAIATDRPARRSNLLVPACRSSTTLTPLHRPLAQVLSSARLYTVGGGILADFGRKREPALGLSPHPGIDLKYRYKTTFSLLNRPLDPRNVDGRGQRSAGRREERQSPPPLCSVDQATLVRVDNSFCFMKHRSRGRLRQFTCHRVFTARRNRFLSFSSRTPLRHL